MLFTHCLSKFAVAPPTAAACAVFSVLDAESRSLVVMTHTVFNAFDRVAALLLALTLVLFDAFDED